jgi:uncharacterized protein (UPF0332 family)
MNPREFLQLAFKLKGGPSPAEYRSAISRAYYAAYNVGVEKLNEMNCPIDETRDGHTQVQFFLNCAGSRELSKASSQLNELRTKRNKADYQLKLLNAETSQNSEAAVIQADRIIKVIDTLLSSGPSREQITDKIKAYRNKTHQ